MADPRALLAQAEKALAGASGGFSFFGGRTEKYEHAADLFVQAGNAFRLQKMGKEAGAALERAAAIQQSNLSEPSDAAQTHLEAFKSYRTASPPDAARVLSLSIAHYTSVGNFRRAATQQQSLAELYEQVLNDKAKALESYDTAAGWFEGDNAEALSNKLWLKVGELAGETGDYARAVGCFERVAKGSLGSNLMRWSVKEYFLKAGICHLASGDMVAARRALGEYTSLDPTFQATRECALLNDLVEAVEGGDEEAFSDKLFQFDQVQKLDRWKTELLLKVKEKIAGAEDDFS